MSVVSRVPEVALPRPEVSHRSIQVAADATGRHGDRLAPTPRSCPARRATSSSWRSRSARLRWSDSARRRTAGQRPRHVLRRPRRRPGRRVVAVAPGAPGAQPQGRRSRLGGVPTRHRRDVPGVRRPGDASRWRSRWTRPGSTSRPRSRSGSSACWSSASSREWACTARACAGEAAAKVLVVGGERAAAELATWFAKHPTAGYEVCGVWVPDESQPLAAITGDAPRGVPVMSSGTRLRRGPRAVRRHDGGGDGHRAPRSRVAS